MTADDRAGEIARAADQVRARIARAAERSGRHAADVTLVAVSKTHPATDVVAAIAAGITDVGENRVTEAETKRGLVEGAGGRARWHLVGHLQSNKARRALATFDLIQSVDSLALARRLAALVAESSLPTLPLLVQVRLGDEPTKSGADPADVPALCHEIASLGGLRLAGLMAIPPPSDDPNGVRPWVQALRLFHDEVRRLLPTAAADVFREISIGMSHDYEAAIEEGATIVRVGTAIFGARA